MPILNTPEAIKAYHLASLIACLKIEIHTGMTMSRRGSLLKQAKKSYGIQSRTKAGALEELEVIYEQALREL